MQRNDNQKSTRSSFGFWLILGICLGLVFGAALDNFPLGIALGPSFGILLWAFFKHETERDHQGKVDSND